MILDEAEFKGRYLPFFEALNDRYIIPEMRYRKGAYGANLTYSIGKKLIGLGTSNDPNCRTTMEALDETPAILREMELTDEDLIWMFSGQPNTGLANTFGIGNNDAADKDFEVKYFKRNYNELIQVIKRVNPDCAILFVTNNDSYSKVKGRRKKVRYEVNPNGKVVEEAFMELGKQHNAAVWDQFDIMGGLRSMQNWENAELAQKDKVHFTSSGYRLIGDLLYNALISRYIEHVKANAKQQMK
jgi:hypothetical protein